MSAPSILVVDENLGIVIGRVDSVDAALSLKANYLAAPTQLVSNGGATFMGPDPDRKVVLAEVIE